MNNIKFSITDCLSVYPFIPVYQKQIKEEVDVLYCDLFTLCSFLLDINLVLERCVST